MCAVALLLSAHGGMLDPRSWGFVPAVMVLLLPVVAVISLVWLAVVTLMRRWWHAAAMAVAVVAVAPQLLTLCPLGMGGDASGCGIDTLRVMTYNVAAFPHIFTEDSNDVMRTILDLDADVVLMQEVPHCDLDFKYDTVRGLKPYYEELNRKFPYRSYTHNDEVAVMSKFPFTIDTIVPAKRGYDTLNYFQDMEHYPCLAFDVVVNGHPVRLISAHLQSYGLSNADKSITGTEAHDFDVMQGSRVDGMSMPQKLSRAFALRADDAQNLRNAIDDGPQDVIVCGDFNDVPGSYCYRTVMGDDMHDAFAQCGRGYGYTYGMHRFFFKIDHILYRGSMQALETRVYNDLSLTYTASDHYPQVTTFRFTK